MATATSSGIIVPYPQNAFLTAAGQTSSGAAATLVNTQFNIPTDAHSIYLVTSSDSNTLKIITASPGGSYGATDNIGITAGTAAQSLGQSPPLALTVPITYDVIASNLAVDWRVETSSGSLLPATYSPVTSGSTSMVSVPLNERALIRVAGYRPVASVNYTSNITGTTMSSTGTSYTLAATTETDVWRLTPASTTVSDAMTIKAQSIYDATTTMSFTLTPVITLAVAQAISATYVLSTT